MEVKVVVTEEGQGEYFIAKKVRVSMSVEAMTGSRTLDVFAEGVMVAQFQDWKYWVRTD